MKNVVWSRDPEETVEAEGDGTPQPGGDGTPQPGGGGP